MLPGVEVAIASDQSLSVIPPPAARGIREATGGGEDKEVAQMVLQDNAANDTAVAEPAPGQVPFTHPQIRTAVPEAVGQLHQEGCWGPALLERLALAAVSLSGQVPNSPPGAGAPEPQPLQP